MTVNVNSAITASVSLTVTNLSTLASANYATSNLINTQTNKPLDVVVDITVTTTNTPAGNKQVVVFLITSTDNTNFTSANSSVTDTTHDQNMKLLGVIPVPTASVAERGNFSILAALGYLPPYCKAVCKNDLGVALTSGTAQVLELYNQLV